MGPGSVTLGLGWLGLAALGKSASVREVAPSHRMCGGASLLKVRDPCTVVRATSRKSASWRKLPYLLYSISLSASMLLSTGWSWCSGELGKPCD